MAANRTATARHPGKLPDRLLSCDVGDCVAEAVRLSVGAVEWTTVPEAFETMKNRLTTAIARVRVLAHQQGEAAPIFTVSRGSFHSDDYGYVIACMVATRTE